MHTIHHHQDFPMPTKSFFYKTNSKTRKPELKIKPISQLGCSQEISDAVYVEYLSEKQNDYNSLAAKFKITAQQIAKIITSKFQEKRI